MAKKNKDKKDGAQAEAVDSIRAAIERGLQMSAEGAQATQKRTRELVDEIASAAGRVRQSLEDMRVLDELRKLRTEIEALAARVAALERPGSSASSASAAKPAARRTSRPRAAAKKTTAARKSTSARKSTAAKKSTAKKTTARKPTTRKSTSTRAKKPAAAAKPATTSPSPSSGGSSGSSASS